MKLEKILAVTKKICEKIKEECGEESIIKPSDYGSDKSTIMVYVDFEDTHNGRKLCYELSDHSVIHFIDNDTHILITGLDISVYMSKEKIKVLCYYQELQNDEYLVDTYSYDGGNSFIYDNLNNEDDNNIVTNFVKYSKEMYYMYLTSNLITALCDSNNYDNKTNSYDYHTSYMDNKLTIHFHQDISCDRIDEYTYYSITKFNMTIDKDNKTLCINYVLDDYEVSSENVNINISMDKLKENDNNAYKIILNLKNDAITKDALQYKYYNDYINS
jgi:hypothetical protein